MSDETVVLTFVIANYPPRLESLGLSTGGAGVEWSAVQGMPDNNFELGNFELVLRADPTPPGSKITVVRRRRTA